jgi:hypothetical protein
MYEFPCIGGRHRRKLLPTPDIVRQNLYHHFDILEIILYSIYIEQLLTSMSDNQIQNLLDSLGLEGIVLRKFAMILLVPLES